MSMKTYYFNDYKTTKKIYLDIFSFLKEKNIKYVIEIKQEKYNISFNDNFSWDIFKILCGKYSNRHSKTFAINKGNESIYLSKNEFKKLTNNEYDFNSDTKMRMKSYNKYWYEKYIKFFE